VGDVPLAHNLDRGMVPHVHNAVSQVLLPKVLGAGSPHILGESGLLPVALYLFAAGATVGRVWARGGHWRDFARQALR
jgi:hypothetical protein